MQLSGDTLENIYFGFMLLVAASLAWNGWRQGVVRQAMTLLAIVAAYTVGWFGRKPMASVFGFLRYPEQVTEVIGGAAAGLATFIAIRAFSAFVFKRTKDKRPGGVRTSYGVFGALLGVVFAGIVFVVTSDVIRLAGAIAKSNVEVMEMEQKAYAEDPRSLPPLDPDAGGFVKGLAKLGSALDRGSSGTVIQAVDPVPPSVYGTIIKLGIMVSRPDAVERFRSYPGVSSLTEHPKLNALFVDPEVAKLIDSKSYFKLLRNEKLVALANDAEFSEQVKKMDLDAALNFALSGQPGAAPVSQ